ncbi:MAG: 1,3-beta-galactosyl-N-acetylhexosamine phosphorylase [Hespellia sp.]|nr:1,3-beta-galactosyl-N-acetylhexosamine phosphorylase [Hespellia sp.]
MKSTGRMTLPSESNFLEQTKEMLDKLGADAIRDSDGTKLDDEIKQLDARIYTTYFVARGHNEFAREHMDECQQLYLMSKHHTAKGGTLSIDFMDGYYGEQVVPDYIHDVKKWWEVIDRTEDKVVSPEDWELRKEENQMILTHAKPFHEYTVSFLVYAIWDPTQMYNHITNNWGDKPHDIPFDVRQTNSGTFAKEYLIQWLKENPRVDVVRFTTFFYHFTLVFNDQAKEKFVDWFGYGATVSVRALEEFEEEYGYALRPEDIVDKGYYNSTFRVPTKHYLDYMTFVQKFVARKAKELVDIVHDAGREAMMFLGDNWIGTEPYGPYFEEIGLDAVVGSVGGGATLRLISDIPHVKYTEGRFLPYFFPDTFYEGNDPCIEAAENWLSARRAIMRKPIDRMGYGGYLSLAYKFPAFTDYIAKVADEFRMISDNIGGSKPYSPVTVGILNCWGKIRSWQCFMVAHALWYKQIYSYLGVLESLSGAAVEVKFINFEDLENEELLDELDVIINAGDAMTAFSGGEKWQDEKLVSRLRKWVYDGGGFVGIGEPSAYEKGGRFFQMADVLGVDKELGFTLSTDKYFTSQTASHFITKDAGDSIDFGESMKNIYALSEETEIAEYSNGEIHLAAHDYGKGRGVYIAGLPYSYKNTRLLLRSIYYACRKENEFDRWSSDNLFCEVNVYPETGLYAILNNSNETQQTNFYNADGVAEAMELRPGEIIWRRI